MDILPAGDMDVEFEATLLAFTAVPFVGFMGTGGGGGLLLEGAVGPAIVLVLF